MEELLHYDDFKEVFRQINLCIERLDDMHINFYAGQRACTKFSDAFVKLVYSTAKHFNLC